MFENLIWYCSYLNFIMLYFWSLFLGWVQTTFPLANRHFEFIYLTGIYGFKSSMLAFPYFQFDLLEWQYMYEIIKTKSVNMSLTSKWSAKMWSNWLWTQIFSNWFLWNCDAWNQEMTYNMRALGIKTFSGFNM